MLMSHKLTAPSSDTEPSKDFLTALNCSCLIAYNKHNKQSHFFGKIHSFFFFFFLKFNINLIFLIIDNLRSFAEQELYKSTHLDFWGSHWSATLSCHYIIHNDLPCL